jgi:hypothetical protein
MGFKHKVKTPFIINSLNNLLAACFLYRKHHGSNVIQNTRVTISK